MKIQLEYPYADYNGYLVVNSEGRRNVCLVHKLSKKRTTVSYARYLVSVHLKRVLLPNEQVDHIDGIKSNDILENLQILSKLDNNRKNVVETNRSRKMVRMTCPNCDKVFEKAFNSTHLQKKGHYTSCSKKCSYTILSKGFSITELKMLGNTQVIEVFRKPPAVSPQAYILSEA